MSRRTSIRWRSAAPADPGTRYVVHGGVFTVEDWRGVLRFVRASRPVMKNLRTADGLVGAHVHADIRHKRFVAITAWTDHAALRDFVKQPTHARGARATRGLLARGSKLVGWECYGSELPPRPDDVARRLEAVPGLGELDGSSGEPVDAGGAHHPA